VAGVVVAIAIVATLTATRTPKAVQCALNAEPEKVLDLQNPNDRAHLTNDLARVRTIAEQYREQVRQSRPQSQSIAARNSFAARPDRAFAYCVAILDDQIAATHHVDFDKLASR